MLTRDGITMKRWFNRMRKLLAEDTTWSEFGRTGCQEWFISFKDGSRFTFNTREDLTECIKGRCQYYTYREKSI